MTKDEHIHELQQQLREMAGIFDMNEDERKSAFDLIDAIHDILESPPDELALRDVKTWALSLTTPVSMEPSPFGEYVKKDAYLRLYSRWWNLQCGLHEAGEGEG